MKNFLLSTSAVVALASMGASAHVRDGLVETTPTAFEVRLQGEVSAYQAVTMISAEDKSGKDLLVNRDTNYYGQNYSADIDFIAKAHVRGWEVSGVVKLDVDSAGTDGLDVDSVYMDFKHGSVGTFRLGRGAAPSDFLSIEASLPGENYEDVKDLFAGSGLNLVFGGLGNSRFADTANQIGYYSPKFGDMFQFGVAYIMGKGKVVTKEDPSNPGTYVIDSISTSLDDDNLFGNNDDDALEVALRFENEWGGFKFGVSGAYRHYLTEYLFGDIYGAPKSKWTTGLVIGIMGLDWTTTYGRTDYTGTYLVAGPQYGTHYNSEDWGIRSGLTYSWDRWEAGIAYEMGESRFDNKSKLVEAGLSLRVFTGLNVHGAVAYAWGEDSFENTAKATQFRTGMDLTW